MDLQKNIFEHFSCQETHKSASKKLGAQIDLEPFQIAIPWPGALKHPRVKYSTQVVWNLDAMFLYMSRVPLMRTLACSAHAPSRMRSKPTHWRGVLRLILMRRTCTWPAIRIWDGISADVTRAGEIKFWAWTKSSGDRKYNSKWYLCLEVKMIGTN